jgi:hypothetical protein
VRDGVNVTVRVNDAVSVSEGVRVSDAVGETVAVRVMDAVGEIVGERVAVPVGAVPTRVRYGAATHPAPLDVCNLHQV